MSLDPAAVRALVRAYGRPSPYVPEAHEPEPEPVDAVAPVVAVVPVVVGWIPAWQDEAIIGNIMGMLEYGKVRQACVAQRPGEPVEVWWRI